MNRLIALLDSDIFANLLTALLHSLWQALVIAGLLLLFLRSKAAKNSNVRYTAALTALTAILLCGLFTWAVLEYEPPATTEASTIAPSAQKTVSTTISAESNEKKALADVETIEPESPSENSKRSNWRIWRSASG